MKILMVHNSYQQQGGEDVVVQAEVSLLRQHGHDVDIYDISNHDISSNKDKAVALLTAHRNKKRSNTIADIAKSSGTDLVHVHNFFPLISPYVHRALFEAGIPSVQTLHNYRITCASATLLRDEVVCEKCVDGSPLWGVVHRCYRKSLPGSLALYRMIKYIRNSGIWDYSSKVIALTDFSKSIYIRAGVPEYKIALKPNFVEDYGGSNASRHQDFLFVGRISEEKGIRQLIDAMRLIPNIRLRVAGDGPLLTDLKSASPHNVVFLGRLQPAEIREEMTRAAALIMPSIWYEGMPMTLLEALEVGLPVFASDIGGFPEMIMPGVNGVLFPAGSSTAIANIMAVVATDKIFLEKMSRGARRSYEERYTSTVNYSIVLDIYRDAISNFDREFSY